MKNPDFKECDECAAKPGSPYLCAGCINNRSVIEYLKEIIRAYRTLADFNPKD